MAADYVEARERMVREQLVSRGINDPRVLRAVAKVPRHLFLASELWDDAYEAAHWRESDNIATLYGSVYG